MDTLTSTMKETSCLSDKELYACHNDNFNKQFPKRPNLSDITSLKRKMSDSILMKEELRRNSILASQKVQFKEFQMDGITSYGVSTDRFRSSSPTASKDDHLKSYVPKPVNLHKRRIWNIYNMGTALLAGNGLFHSWMLCLPMLIIVQSSYYNFIRLLLSTMFVLYFTKWSPYYKIYQLIHWMVTLVRFKRVEKFCEKCERQLLQQLNNPYKQTKPKSVSTLLGLEGKDSDIQDQRIDNDFNCNLAKISRSTKYPQRIGWRLRSWRRFPWRIFSRNWGKLANTEICPQFINTFLIMWYANGFGCNVDECEKPYLEYKTLGQFFIRKLKPGIRPVHESARLVSPADGTFTHFGQFKGGFLEQIKGSHYSINYFLGLQPKSSKNNLNANDHMESSHASISEKALTSHILHHKDGSTVLMQMIVYLSPGDYHRFHSPADWSVNYRRHFPGELLSVKPSIARYFPGLFHLNERVCWFGEWIHGFFSMTAVAATNVGDIVEDGQEDDDRNTKLESLKTNQAYGLKRDCTFMGTCSQVGKKFLYFSERQFETPRVYKKGDPFGHFNFGSTIVLLFEIPKEDINNFSLNINDKLKVGEAVYM